MSTWTYKVSQIHTSYICFYYCILLLCSICTQQQCLAISHCFIEKDMSDFQNAPLLPSGADLFVDGWIRAPQRPEIQSQTLNHPTDHFQVTLYGKNHPGLSSKNTIKLFTVKASTILSVLTWKILQHCTSVTRANWFGKISASENSPVTLHKKLFCSELLD